MRVHLFSNKKKCPALRNDVELTDEVKNHILAKQEDDGAFSDGRDFQSQGNQRNNFSYTTRNNLIYCMFLKYIFI